MGVVVSLSTKTLLVPRSWSDPSSLTMETRAILTYKGNVDILEACVVRRSYGDSSFNGIHGRIRGNDLAGTVSVIELDLNGWLAIVGDGAHLAGQLAPNGLHRVGVGEH